MILGKDGKIDRFQRVIRGSVPARWPTASGSWRSPAKCPGPLYRRVGRCGHRDARGRARRCRVSGGCRAALKGAARPGEAKRVVAAVTAGLLGRLASAGEPQARPGHAGPGCSRSAADLIKKNGA